MPHAPFSALPAATPIPLANPGLPNHRIASIGSLVSRRVEGERKRKSEAAGDRIAELIYIDT